MMLSTNHALPYATALAILDAYAAGNLPDETVIDDAIRAGVGESPEGRTILAWRDGTAGEYRDLAILAGVYPDRGAALAAVAAAQDCLASVAVQPARYGTEPFVHAADAVTTLGRLGIEGIEVAPDAIVAVALLSSAAYSPVEPDPLPFAVDPDAIERVLRSTLLGGNGTAADFRALESAAQVVAARLDDAGDDVVLAESGRSGIYLAVAVGATAEGLYGSLAAEIRAGQPEGAPESIDGLRPEDLPAAYLLGGEVTCVGCRVAYRGSPFVAFMPVLTREVADRVHAGVTPRDREEALLRALGLPVPLESVLGIDLPLDDEDREPTDAELRAIESAEPFGN